MISDIDLYGVSYVKDGKRIAPEDVLIGRGENNNMINNTPIAVWIAGAIILGMIVIALIGYGAGLWEVEP